MVPVKVNADGRVTFKNTGTKPVDLYVRAVGFTTSSPGTGADHQKSKYLGWEKQLVKGEKAQYQIAGGFLSDLPSTGIAAIPVHIHVYGAAASGYLKLYPTGQEPQAASMVNFNTSTAVDRTSEEIVMPGNGGYITVEKRLRRQRHHRDLRRGQLPRTEELRHRRRQPDDWRRTHQQRPVLRLPRPGDPGRLRGLWRQQRGEELLQRDQATVRGA